jgi:hypothetical protein
LYENTTENKFEDEEVGISIKFWKNSGKPSAEKVFEHH